jgi:hypothetical protein
MVYQLTSQLNTQKKDNVLVKVTHTRVHVKIVVAEIIKTEQTSFDS